MFMRFLVTDTATTEFYTLSLHDALPICKRRISGMALLILALLQRIFLMSSLMLLLVWLILEISFAVAPIRSEERFSRNAETDLVCRLLLEKKKKTMKGRRFTIGAGYS